MFYVEQVYWLALSWMVEYLGLMSLTITLEKNCLVRFPRWMPLASLDGYEVLPMLETR